MQKIIIHTKTKRKYILLKTLSFILSVVMIFTIVSALDISKFYAENLGNGTTHVFNNHTYRLITNDTDWYTAKKICESLGGHLVTITSADEQSYIYHTLLAGYDSNVMIGLSDCEVEGVWKWITGEPLQYTNWGYGEPNNASEEDYALIRPSGTWNDGHCDSEKWSYICEWDYITDHSAYFSGIPILTRTDALNFMCFLYNDTLIEKDVSNTTYYKLLTGSFRGTPEQYREAAIAFSIFARARLNEQITNAEYNLQSSYDYLYAYFSDELAGMDDLPLEIVKEYMKEGMDYLETALLDLLFNSVVDNTNLSISAVQLDWTEAMIDGADGALNMAASVGQYIDYAIAAVQGCRFVIGKENQQRYWYFASYLNNRPAYASATDEPFVVLDDANFTICSLNSSGAELIDSVGWITGKDSWINHRENIQRWAEFLYQVEMYAEKDTHSYAEEVIAPTCYANGYTKNSCIYCEKTYQTDQTNALGHNLSFVKSVASTCTSDGYNLYSCSRCDHTEKEITSEPLGHNLQYSAKTSPTCTAQGYDTYRCSRCGYTEKQNITSPLGHDYVFTSSITPTCTERGYDMYTCSRCLITEERNTIAASGHNYTDGICVQCNTAEAESAHPYANNTDDICTITRPGAKRIAITFSTDTQVEKNIDYIRVYAVGALQVAIEIGRYTGTELAGQRLVIQGDTVNIRLISDDSNVAYGYKISEIKAYYTDCTAHDKTILKNMKAPTCTQEGYTGDTHCYDCDTLLQIGTVIPATGHSYTDDVCTVCNAPLGLAYSFSEETVTITGYTGDSTALSLPSVIEGKTVTKIDTGAFSDNITLQKLTVPNTVTNVAPGAFRNSFALSEICVEPGNSAYCSENGVLFNTEKTALYVYPAGKAAITYTIPASVTSISADAFYRAVRLQEIAVEAENTAFTSEDGILFNATKTNLYVYPAGKQAAAYCVPSSVTVIGEFAFSGATHLNEIVLPENLTEVYSSAFEGMGLYNNEDNWKNGILYIGSYLIAAKADLQGDCHIQDGTAVIVRRAFSHCENVKSIYLPYHMREIMPYGFEFCTALKNVYLNYGLQTIGTRTFEGTAVEELYLPATVQSTLTNSQSITSWANSAFYGATCLRKIVVGEGMTDLPKGAFAGCSTLETIVLPKSLSSAPTAGVFFKKAWNSNCPALKEIIGYSGSFAETLATENGYIFSTLSTPVTNGDVNRSGKADETDYEIMKGYALGVETPSKEALLAADLNGDGVLDMFDVSLMNMILSGICALPGDVNGDDALSATDYSLLVDASVGAVLLTDEQIAAADLNDDGAVDAFDAALLNLRLNNSC